MVRKDSRKNSLLRLIADLGGESTREQINEKIGDYWELRKEELEIEEGVGKPLYWHHVASVCQSLKDKDDYVENPKRGVWKITVKGKDYLSSFGFKPSVRSIVTREPSITEDLPLCKQLRESQRNSEDPTMFEKVIANAFRLLGLSAKHIGGRDEPDILIEDYKIILDGKSTKEGVITSENAIGFDRLERYKDRYNVSYIGVVAPGFSEGYIRETAKKRGFVLIETEAICMILQNHAIYPYETNRIVEILFKSDKDIITSNDIPLSTVDQEKLIEIVARILSTLKNFERSGITSFSNNIIRIALVGQSYTYETDEIDNALKFLSLAPFSILRKQNDEYSLTGDIDSTLKKIGLLLQAFNKIGR